MSDSDRKVFPVESVLALVVGKEGVDIKDIAGYVVGALHRLRLLRQGRGAVRGGLAGPAGTPKFMDLTWSEDQSWKASSPVGAACWATMSP